MNARAGTVNPTTVCHITDSGVRAVDHLARASGLPKGRIKDAMVKGAVWLKRGAKERRLRRATAELMSGDRLALYYDARVLALEAPTASLVHESSGWSAWFKPVGLLTQGSRQGDHCALLRQVENHYSGRREVKLVHRLDREASGLVLIAHQRRAAAALSRQFAQRNVTKLYRVLVQGLPEVDRIDQPIDGKPAVTRISTIGRQADAALLEVRIETGRKHQIRRHLAAIGCPVLGDTRYNDLGHNADGLRLVAVLLGFDDPQTGRAQELSLPQPMWPEWATTETDHR